MRRFVLRFVFLCAVGSSVSCTSSSELNSDQDGVKGGDFVFVVTATDSAFTPSILKAQNLANVTVMFQSSGTRPHGFRIDGVDAATLAPVAPNASATLKFTTPEHEAIYTIGSTAPGDTMQGQLIVQ